MQKPHSANQLPNGVWSHTSISRIVYFCQQALQNLSFCHHIKFSATSHFVLQMHLSNISSHYIGLPHFLKWVDPLDCTSIVASPLSTQFSSACFISLHLFSTIFQNSLKVLPLPQTLPKIHLLTRLVTVRLAPHQIPQPLLPLLLHTAHTSSIVSCLSSFNSTGSMAHILLQVLPFFLS